ncbi:hypothetical protein [Fangia hongkongensis]|uniref:hypothetical protein n=1 Tax=Fangia hongkongensis TaxID=270495 RepID=UPI000381F228|nr:hypothetical protein [Fangia hongkongensis]MBK2125748.1 hypothetical protein [Fangia hongkongensis]
MSLLTGKYAMMLFGAVGAAAVLVFIILAIKKYRQAKQIKNKIKLPKAKKKKAAPKVNVYKDVTKKILKTSKRKALPAFMCLYEGDSSQMMSYIGRFVNLESAESIMLNDSQVVVIEEGRIFFVISMQDLQNVNPVPLNNMLISIYQKGAIQLPTLLVCLTEQAHQPGQFVLFQKFLSELYLYQKHEFNLELTVDLKEDDKKMKSFFELVKQQTSINFQRGMTEKEVAESIKENMASIRNKISAHIVTNNALDESIIDAMQVAASIEKAIMPLASFIAELSNTQEQNTLESINVNFGIHHSNYYYTFFDSATLSYKKPIRLSYVAVSVLVVISLFATVAFVYNAYHTQKFNDYVKQNSPFANITSGDLRSAEQRYTRWYNLYKQGLVLGFLYGHGSFTRLNEEYAEFLLKKIILPKMRATNDPVSKAVFLAVLAAPNSSDVANSLQDQNSLLTLMTGLSDEQLNLMYEYATFKDIDRLSIGSQSYMQQGGADELKFASRNLFSTEVFDQFVLQNILHFTNNQLKDFIGKSVVLHREVCLLKDVLPNILSSTKIDLSQDASKFGSFVANNLPKTQGGCDNSSILLSMQDLIPNNNELQVKSFAQAVDLLVNYNQKVDKFFSSNEAYSVEKSKWKGVLISAELNSILYDVLKSNRGDLNLLYADDYYQYTFNTVFSRNVSKVSLAYTKSIILDEINPLLERYKLLASMFGQYNINYQAFDRLKEAALANYAQSYIDTLNYVLKNALPADVSSDNLQMFLIDITSDNTPFSHMLDYIKKNTTFSKDQVLPKALDKINKEFQGLDSFVSSKDYQDYKNILLSISNTLYQNDFQNYMKTYEQLSDSGQNSLAVKLNTLVAKVGYSNPNVYKLFNVPLSTIKSALAQRLISNIKMMWNKDVTPKISFAQAQFPLNLNAKESISAEALNDMFGVQGDVFNQMKRLLSAFISFDKTKNAWVVDESLTSDQRKTLAPYIETFNNFFHLQKALWDDTGKPKNIDFKVKSMPFKQVSLDGKNKMVLSFIQAGSGSQALGLNTQNEALIPLSYAWQLQPTVSVGWLNTGNVSFQKTYQGEWAFFKMLADAKCDKNWVCTWEVKGDNDKVAPYQVSFEIKSPILKLITKRVQPQAIKAES